jgi:hypothetical protein
MNTMSTTRIGCLALLLCFSMLRTSGQAFFVDDQEYIKELKRGNKRKAAAYKAEDKETHLDMAVYSTQKKSSGHQSAAADDRRDEYRCSDIGKNIKNNKNKDKGLKFLAKKN